MWSWWWWCWNFTFLSNARQLKPLKPALMRRKSCSGWMENVSESLLRLNKNRTNECSVINILKCEIRGKTQKHAWCHLCQKKKYQNTEWLHLYFSKIIFLCLSWHRVIFIVTLSAQPKKMMNGGAVNSRKLFISEKLRLHPKLSIVWKLAFFKVLCFFEVMFYPLPESRTLAISFSSPFIISEKLENKKAN